MTITCSSVLAVVSVAATAGRERASVPVAMEVTDARNILRMAGRFSFEAVGRMARESIFRIDIGINMITFSQSQPLRRRTMFRGFERVQAAGVCSSCAGFLGYAFPSW